MTHETSHDAKRFSMHVPMLQYVLANASVCVARKIRMCFALNDVVLYPLKSIIELLFLFYK